MNSNGLLRKMRYKAVFVPMLVCASTYVLFEAALAQSNCPTLQRETTTINYPNGTTSTTQDQGLYPGAAVNTQVVDNAVGDFPNGTGGTPDAVGAISTADQNYAAAYSATVQVTNTDTYPANYKQNTNISNVTHVVEQATQDQINALGGNCVGKTACTAWGVNQYGFTTWIDTLELPIIPTGSLQEQLQSHEDSHGMGGFLDCNDCANTTANPSVNSDSPTGPTTCDKSAINPAPCPVK